jgi:hypothetical protein
MAIEGFYFLNFLSFFIFSKTEKAISIHGGGWGCRKKKMVVPTALPSA